MKTLGCVLDKLGASHTPSLKTLMNLSKLRQPTVLCGYCSANGENCSTLSANSNATKLTRSKSAQEKWLSIDPVIRPISEGESKPLCIHQQRDKRIASRNCAPDDLRKKKVTFQPHKIDGSSGGCLKWEVDWIIKVKYGVVQRKTQKSN